LNNISDNIYGTSVTRGKNDIKAAISIPNSDLEINILHGIPMIRIVHLIGVMQSVFPTPRIDKITISKSELGFESLSFCYKK